MGGVLFGVVGVQFHAIVELLDEGEDVCVREGGFDFEDGEVDLVLCRGCGLILGHLGVDALGVGPLGLICFCN